MWIPLTRKDGTKTGELQINAHEIIDQLDKPNLKLQLEKYFSLPVALEQIIESSHSIRIHYFWVQIIDDFYWNWNSLNFTTPMNEIINPSTKMINLVNKAHGAVK